jgi:hypothetical protein
MEQHEKNPQNRIVSSNRGQQERVVKSPKPSGTIFRENLQGGGVFWCSEQIHEPYHGTRKKEGKGRVCHGNQYDKVDRFHGNPPFPLRGQKKESPMKGDRSGNPRPFF